MFKIIYPLRLCCYIIVELKATEFDSRDAGQMSAYLSAVDDQLRHIDDRPSIWIILCKTKDNVFAEYVLRNFNRPIGVFEVKLVEKLPKDLKASLPTVEEIEAELSVIPEEKKRKPRKKKMDNSKSSLPTTRGKLEITDCIAFISIGQFPVWEPRNIY